MDSGVVVECIMRSLGDSHIWHAEVFGEDD